MKYLQKLGKSLLIPVSCLPVCSILMGIGYLLCPAGMQGGEIVGLWGKIGYFLVTAGGAVINNMPILFALGVGIGMADGEGLGAVSALVSWLMINTLLSGDTVTKILPQLAENQTVMLALSKIENPFIGILAGLIGAFCILRFKDVRLPPWLSFFSGKRLGIIIAGVVSIAASAILAVVWPFLFSGLVFLGEKIAAMGYLGSAIYATLNRLLIPFGLHHALNNVFWFDTIGIGDLTAFWAGKTSEQVGWSLGMYMTGFFPSMMFGIPAAALAMRKSFRHKDRRTGSMLLSAAVSALLCGVTEPFEFLFMFQAPALYAVYAVLFGVFTYIANIIGFRAGFSFSGGLIDLIFSASLPAAQKTLLIIPLGIAAFAVYYLVFRLMIVKFDLKTPGREALPADDAPIPETPVKTGKAGDIERAAGIIGALGGRENIVSVSHCATRLRIEVKDSAVCDDAAIRNAGAAGVMKLGKDAVQVVIGLDVEFVAEEVKRQLASPCTDTPDGDGNMTVLRAKTGNAGIAVGPAFFLREAPIPEKKTVSDPAAEEIRFAGALEQVLRTLRASADEADEKAREILSAQVTMLEDATFTGSIREKIGDRMNAAYAAYLAGEEAAMALEKAEDAYLKARAADLRDVAGKLSAVLMGVDGVCSPAQPSILFAKTLTPEQLTRLDRSLILGIVTTDGSAASHTAILAGNYGIPYLFGADCEKARAAAPSLALIDAADGTVILSPNEATRERYAAKQQAERDALLTADHYHGSVRVLANIAKPEDIRDALAEGADGVGLYRSEFLFMNRKELPDEQEQFTAYRTVLEGMDGREVVIRTLDIGADKRTDCLPLAEEENPALGRRAIRICLDEPELFRTQLRALLRAAVYGNAAILYPMITSTSELDAIGEQVTLAAKELDERGERYRIPPQGVMIETPAAAMISDLLAEKCDFFSIGSNDLTQYTIALDRQAKGLERYYDPHHEAVLRLIALSIENAHKKGIPAGVCGELGGDTAIVPKLAEMGIDKLSVSPFKIKAVRSALTRAESTSKASAPTAEPETPLEYEELYAPADGILLPMEQIPDPAFSGGMLGKCVGVIPENGNLYAPCAGTVTMVAATGHAIGIRSEKGRNVLIHVGINTVTLGGKGFDCCVGVGDPINAGDQLITFDLEGIREASLDPTVIIACEDGDR